MFLDCILLFKTRLKMLFSARPRVIAIRKQTSKKNYSQNNPKFSYKYAIFMRIVKIRGIKIQFENDSID